MKQQKAFSLGEILLTLFILGVLFTVILPILTNNTNERQRAAAVKKGYQTLSKAYANEYAITKRPSSYNNEDAIKLFNGLRKQIGIKAYYKFVTDEETEEITVEEITAPEDDKYFETWIEGDDSVSFLVQRGGNSRCASKLEVNEKESNEDAIASTCLYVTMDVNGSAEPNKLCGDDEHIPSLLCDRVNFYVTDNSIASGNSEHVIGGRFLYDGTDKDD